ncbi:DnaJ domain-containing protein [Entophlyctis helioformis]|nr:DnaJ domain-containing protein [Entophlyctis helioformis]
MSGCTPVRTPVRIAVRAYNALNPAGWPHKACPYSLLGVPKTCSPKDIKDGYYERSKECHPDKTLLLPEDERRLLQERYLLLQDAYTMLSDPLARRDYDARPPSFRHDGGPTTIRYDPPFNKLGVVMPWFYGLGFLSIMSYIWTSNINETRRREEELAWIMFNRQRQKEGLGDVVGTKPHPFSRP